MAKKLRPRYLGMASQTQRYHQLWIVVARLAVVNCNRPFATLQGRAARYGTAIPVSRQDLFAVTAEVFIVLTPQRVAGRTKPEGENLIVSARAANRAL